MKSLMSPKCAYLAFIRVGQWVASVHKILKVLLLHQLVFIVPATHELEF
jgi:predicted membrane protein